jgi:hypothetical protein
MQIPLHRVHGILTSLPYSSWHRGGFLEWRQGFSLHAPFQELHLLTKPPARGTEAEFMHRATAMLHGPVNRRFHRSPPKSERWSRDSTRSYNLKAPRVEVN